MRFRRVPRLLLLASIALMTSACDEGEGSDDCPPPDMDVCDPVEQRCCAVTEHCVLTYNVSSFVDTCLGGVPEAGEGDPCQAYGSTGPLACVGGLTCLQITGIDPAPVCHRLCRGDEDCLSGSCSESLPGVPIKACVGE